MTACQGLYGRRGGRQPEYPCVDFGAPTAGQFIESCQNFCSPYKQYEAEVIIGVLEGLITCETLGFEDFPCEMTMLRWLSQKAQLLLWRYP